MIISFRCLYKFTRIQTLHSTCKHVMSCVSQNLFQSNNISKPKSLEHGPNMPKQSYKAPNVQLFNSICQIRHPATQWLQALDYRIGGIKKKGTNKPTNHAITHWHSCQMLPGCLDRQKAMMLAPNRHKALAGPN